VEFLTQALQLVHGRHHVEARTPATVQALRGLARACALTPETAAQLADHYRFLRRVSAALRLLGARPSDTLELAGPMPARVAKALGFPSGQALLHACTPVAAGPRTAPRRCDRMAAVPPASADANI